MSTSKDSPQEVSPELVAERQVQVDDKGEVNVAGNKGSEESHAEATHSRSTASGLKSEPENPNGVTDEARVETVETSDEASEKGGKHENLRPFDFRELVPTEWTEHFGPWVWCRFYRAMRLSVEDIKQEPKKVITHDAIAFLLYGQPILPQPSFRFASSDPPVIEARLDEPKVAPLAAYLGTLVPYCRGPSDDFLARCATDSWVGLLRASLGENIAYEQVAEYGVSLEDGSLNFFSPTARNPQVEPGPGVSESGLAFLCSCHSVINQLPVEMRNRVRLALRWYELSSRQSGVDAFLNQWVALEALGMEQQNNVRPIVRILADTYGIDLKDAIEKFGIGRIFGLRSEIMHRGLLPVIHQDLHRYLRGVLRDLLFAKLGFPCRREAEAVLERGDFDLQRLLDYARAVPSNNAAADGPRKRGR